MIFVKGTIIDPGKLSQETIAILKSEEIIQKKEEDSKKPVLQEPNSEEVLVMPQIKQKMKKMRDLPKMSKRELKN
jgi:hypothetical protein